LALVALLIVINAFFVAGEFAMVTVDRSRVSRLTDEGDRTAARIGAGLRQLSFHLSGAQLGITVSSLLLGVVAESALGPIIEPLLERLGVSDTTIPAIAVAFALSLATASQLVFGEVMPKTVAISYPYPTSVRVAVPMIWINNVLGPITRFLNAAANRTVRLLGIEPIDELLGVRSLEEIELIIRSSSQEGEIDAGELALLTRSIAFTENFSADIMIPRVKIVGLANDATVADLLASAVESGHSRFPVYGEDLDDILGVAHVKDSFRVPHSLRGTELIVDYMRPALVVPETQPLDSLMVDLRTKGSGLAVVTDEYGGTAGIVTMEDLLEEILGEIEDEHDAVESTIDEDGVMSGLLHRHAVEELTGYEWPEGRYETLGGLITANLGRIPEAGDVVELDDWLFEVVAVDGFRVESVRMSSTTQSGDPG
jgi:CBS domain containing-hemolysin-like protein